MSYVALPGFCFRPWISLPAGLCLVSTAFTGLECDQSLPKPGHQAKALETSISWKRFADFLICFLGDLSYMLALSLVCSLLPIEEATSSAAYLDDDNCWISNRMIM